MVCQDDVEVVLDSLAEETADYWVDYSVPVLEGASVSQFLREGYARYHPVILKGLIDDWPALSTWSEDYLAKTMGESLVSVNFTLDGRADSVQHVEIDGELQERFVYPAEVKLPLGEFFKQLNREDSSNVPYLSQQNDNLRVEFAALMGDVAPSIPLADEAFGNAPIEAVNLWIGDERSVSSIHKDHFENMYAVVSGAKTFTLMPPTDIAFLPVETFKTARYQAIPIPLGATDDDSPSVDFQLEITTAGCPTETLEWTPIDPNYRAEAIARHPKFRNSRPLHCTVYPGEVLYLPALWYHRVSQAMRTVAVNYWYDMRFDFRFVFYQTVQRMARLCDDCETRLPPAEEDRADPNHSTAQNSQRSEAWASPCASAPPAQRVALGDSLHAPDSNSR